MSRRSIEIDDELWRRVRADAIAEGVPTRVLVARRLGEAYGTKPTIGRQPFLPAQPNPVAQGATTIIHRPSTASTPTRPPFTPVPKPSKAKKKGRK